MSRYCFIWLTYIGAMVAMREGGHLGVDTLVQHLATGGKKACLFVSEALMLFCNGLFLLGTWKMHELQGHQHLAGGGHLHDLGVRHRLRGVGGHGPVEHPCVAVASGQLTEDELVQVVETEDADAKGHGGTGGPP